MKSAIIASLLAFMAASANAYCPNLCSGHGSCGVKDVCTCYEHIGTARGDYDSSTTNYNVGLQKAWTGADCSLRTCPHAFSFSGSTPSGLSESRVLSAAATAGDYVVKTAYDVSGFNGMTAGSKVRFTVSASGASLGLYTIKSVSFSSPDSTITLYEALSGALSTADKIHYQPLEKDTGTYANQDYPKAVQGTHSLLECAGQGICDRSTGECDCFPGYEGEACTRTTCPSDCSGHGICLSASRLASDASETYANAWDATKHYGCKCDVGFRGPDCSLQECPSDYDPLYGCGGGVCNHGPAGIGCGNAGNSDCVAGATTGIEQRDCSGRGICDYESGVCKCFAGFYGQACAQQTILI